LFISSFEDSDKINDLLIDIGTKLFKLGRFHDYLDGRGDTNAFGNLGNEIIELVDKAIEEIKLFDD